MFRTIAALLAATPALVFGVPALADDVSFALINLSSADLTEFYASPVGSDDWQSNILGAALAAGASTDIAIRDAQGCVYDLRMVFADGDALEDSSDICATASYTIH